MRVNPIVKRPPAGLLVLVLVLGPMNRPAHALFRWSKLFSFGQQDDIAKKDRHRTALPGQKVKTIRLEHAKADDLVDLLESYMDGVRSQGSVVSDPTSNTLIVTEDPEAFQRVEFLIHEMDKVYDNPNPRARQMLAGQQMYKAIRSLGPPSGASAGASPRPAATTVASGPSVPAGTAQGPGSTAAPGGPGWQPHENFDADRGPATRRILEDRPAIRGFQLIGWVRDDKGLIVVLRNSGQRYIFRGGKILYGGLGSRTAIPGMSGSVQGKHLILRDGTNGFVKLSMSPRDDEKGGLR